MKRRFSLSLFLFCSLLIASVAEASDLFGTVRFSGKQLRNAEISLKSGAQEMKTRTNENGYYSVRNLNPGKYTITVYLPDRSARQVQVYVFPQSTEKNIEIK
jgi:Carboxypeptidase regulatory-like domain